jgi:enterochelin esterase-like enzyme
VPARIHDVSQLPAEVVHSLRQATPLESPWLAAGVLAAGVLLVAVWVTGAVRRRRAGRRLAHPALTRAGLGGAAMVLGLAGTLLAINSYVGYVPTTAALGNLLMGRSLEPAGSVPAAPGPRTAVGWPHSPAAAARARLTTAPATPADTTGSQIVQLGIGAPALGVPRSPTFVYLPAGYTDPRNAGVRYPVVYLIHGYPGQATDWLVAGRAQQAADLVHRDGLTGPMILVFPTANGGWLHDSECLDAVGGGQKLETYLTRVVVETIDRTFRTVPDRRGRAIGGMSSGGYCALNLGLRHLRTYGTILSSMPYGDPGRGPLRHMLGGDLALFHANSPSWYLSRMPFPEPVAVFLDAGTDDRTTLETARAMARGLAARGEYVALRLAPGLGHTWREASAELPYSLVFASQHLTRAVAT